MNQTKKVKRIMINKIIRKMMEMHKLTKNNFLTRIKFLDFITKNTSEKKCVEAVVDKKCTLWLSEKHTEIESQLFNSSYRKVGTKVQKGQIV